MELIFYFMRFHTFILFLMVKNGDFNKKKAKIQKNIVFR